MKLFLLFLGLFLLSLLVRWYRLTGHCVTDDDVSREMCGQLPKGEEMWQRIGDYEYEYDENGYTGWYRCVGGRLATGRWPAWNYNTGETR